jgi:TadE-like protein
MRMRRSRGRGQGVVEFGVVAILFTLLMFAVVDFGLLLNGWLTVSSDTEKLARDAAVGATTNRTTSPPGELIRTASGFGIPGVTAEIPHFTAYCCNADDALILSVTYYDQCSPNAGSCTEVVPTQLDDRYETTAGVGTCHATTSPLFTCPHPARPSARSLTSFTCNGNPAVSPPCPGDTVVVRLTAAGARVITPLVRPFFNCPDGGASPCYVPMSSTVSMRFDGLPIIPPP